MVAINFSAQFADAVASGQKTQTIRRSARAAAGQVLQLYTGQRTKACRKLADAICVDCTYVGLTARGVRPLRKWREMFSVTTMLSSTSRPSANTKPAMESWLSE